MDSNYIHLSIHQVSIVDDLTKNIFTLINSFTITFLLKLVIHFIGKYMTWKETQLGLGIRTFQYLEKFPKNLEEISIEKMFPKYKLKNDLMCGRTTGGQDDCIWDCEVVETQDGPRITNPLCLRDCFPQVSFILSFYY